MARILLALALPLGVAGAAYGEIAGSVAYPFGNASTDAGGVEGTDDDDDVEFSLDPFTKETCFAKCEELGSGAAEYTCDTWDGGSCGCRYDFPRALHSCAHVCVRVRARARAHSPSPRLRCPLQLPGFRPKVGPKPWLAEAMVLG